MVIVIIKIYERTYFICSEILVSPSCSRVFVQILGDTSISEHLKIWTWRFHRTEEVSNIFSVSWHITHISMAISANLGRDTDHNSTKLVCSHPLPQVGLAVNTRFEVCKLMSISINSYVMGAVAVHLWHRIQSLNKRGSTHLAHLLPPRVHLLACS